VPVPNTTASTFPPVYKRKTLSSNANMPKEGKKATVASMQSPSKDSDIYEVVDHWRVLLVLT